MERRVDSLAKDTKFQRRLVQLGLLKPDSKDVLDEFRSLIDSVGLNSCQKRALLSFTPFGDFTTSPNVTEKYDPGRKTQITAINTYLSQAFRYLAITPESFTEFHRSKSGDSLRIIGGTILLNPRELLITSFIPVRQSGRGISHPQIVKRLFPELDPQDPFLLQISRTNISRIKDKLQDQDYLIKQRNPKGQVEFSLAY